MGHSSYYPYLTHEEMGVQGDEMIDFNKYTVGLVSSILGSVVRLFWLSRGTVFFGKAMWRQKRQSLFAFFLPNRFILNFCSIWPIALDGVYFSVELFIVWAWTWILLRLKLPVKRETAKSFFWVWVNLWEKEGSSIRKWLNEDRNEWNSISLFITSLCFLVW